MTLLSDREWRLVVIALRVLDDDLFKDSLANARNYDTIRSLQQAAREARILADRLEKERISKEK